MGKNMMLQTCQMKRRNEEDNDTKEEGMKRRGNMKKSSMDTK